MNFRPITNFTSAQSRPASSDSRIQYGWFKVCFFGRLHWWDVYWRTRKPEHIEEQENQNTLKKTKRNVALLTEFLQTKGETRTEIAEIPSAEVNELLSEFFSNVRTKEGWDYEPSSLRGMVASFERHLKRKFYPVSVINNLAFESLRKTLHSKQKLPCEQLVSRLA